MESESSVIRSATQPSLESESESKTSTFDPKIPPRSGFCRNFAHVLHFITEKSVIEAVFAWHDMVSPGY